MRIRRIRCPVLALLLLLAPLGSNAKASCPMLTPGQAREQHSLVFLGTVEAVKDSTVEPSTSVHLAGTWRIARLRMSSIWKGTPSREIRILSKLGPETPKLAAGETYVVYADSVARGGFIDRCSRTRPFSKASEDIQALGTPVIVQRLAARKSATPH